MAEITGTRAEQKERTRRRLLDAALDLCEDSSLVGVSLRQVAGRVGIVPTAFYRHFASMEDLGLALVTESFDALRTLLREVREGEPDLERIAASSLDLLVEHVGARRQHFAFLIRERSAGPPAVRAAVRDQLDLVARDLAADLALLPGARTWSAPDLRVAADLAVTALVATAERVVDAAQLRESGDPEEAARAAAETAAAVETARTQLKMLMIGTAHWRSG